MIKEHPEWRVIMTAMAPLIESGKTIYSYSELKEIAGIDIQSSKGRQQFLRFRSEASAKFLVWFECQPGKGYRLIPAREHTSSAHLRVKRASKMTQWALNIVTNTRFDVLSDDEKTKVLASQAAIGVLYLATKETGVKTRKIAASIEYPKLAAALGVAEQTQ